MKPYAGLFIFLLLFALVPGFTRTASTGTTPTDPPLNPHYKEQLDAAHGVLHRILPGHADRFILKIIGQEEGRDVFEIEPIGSNIMISGSTGVALLSGLNHYLKHFCHAAYHFRTGTNMEMPEELPLRFTKIRKVTPFSYRYMFNYCTFSYTMAFWDWEQWEKLIDWMALNGINMPLAPMGQEIIWQRVYNKFGLTNDHLKDFFVGPAYNAFGRMGCIDGYGGPLPQSWIEQENTLQKKILERERQLGMTPVLQGFTGHVPAALIKNNPGVRYTNPVWLDFSPTYLLDWEEPLFAKIGEEFISELIAEYGTDHLYAIDQFIEMTPVIGDTSYLKNMSRTVLSSLTGADPEGKWVLQTWPFTYQTQFWTPERLKAYLDGVPDDRMIALELMGESWERTGWYRHNNWYGKPWIWSVISSFGDVVSMFGGLTGIADNFERAYVSPEKGNLCGIGLMMEGLDYNPVIYDYVAGLIWDPRQDDLSRWKEKYLLSRYGMLNDNITVAWQNIFEYYYTRSGAFEGNFITNRPGFIDEKIWPSKEAVLAAKNLIATAGVLKETDTYRFDLVNLFRQVFGQYAGQVLYRVTRAFRAGDQAEFEEAVEEFVALAESLEQLLATREEFLFGKWIADSRERACNSQEESLYEWNARAIITRWGGDMLYGYALKDWAGLYSSFYLPRWQKFFSGLRNEMVGGTPFDYDSFLKGIKDWEVEWISQREENVSSVPAGDPVELARELWATYGEMMLQYYR